MISQQHKCNVAFDELKRNDEKYTLEQVSFICAYITYAMEQFMEAHELTKLHYNARAWAIDPTASFNAVQLRSDHLSKLLSADAIYQLFSHYKRYGNINLNIIKENKKK